MLELFLWLAHYFKDMTYIYIYIYLISMVLLVRVEMNTYVNLDGLAQQRNIKL